MSASDSLRRDGWAPLRAYAVLSDQRTAALVAADGSVDWLCVPRFDGEPVFGALLDPEHGGRFTLRPAGGFDVTRRYLPDTNVLETTWTTATGTVRVTDALAMAAHRQPTRELLRRVECLSGAVEMIWSVEPRVGWSHDVPECGRLGEVPALFCGDRTLAVGAWGAGEPEAGRGAVRGAWTAQPGAPALLALQASPAGPLLLDGRDAAEARLDQSAAAWRRWIGGCDYDGPWESVVRRSLLVLGACIDEPSGAFVAAPTTSLPERVGGSRNFDYRFCWLRDMTFALESMLRCGLDAAVHTSLAWLLDVTRGTAPDLRVYYSVDGAPGVAQQERDWPGYRDSRPVLTGNDAAGQLQLGGYGDLLDTAWLWVRQGHALDPLSGRQLAGVASHMCDIWRRADAGIWELGSRERDYTKSKADAWATLDRALALAERGAIPGDDAGRWRRTREEIAGWVAEHCWSPELGAYRRSAQDPDELDAAALLLGRIGIARPEQLAGTAEAVRSRLGAGGPLLYRYTGADEQEGAFIACSLWLADALARGGDVDAAAEQIEGIAGLANDVGLLSEEIDPSTGELLGNIPQALSHLALVSAAAIVTERPQAARAAA
jgi:GH15 family glucan-1,4-alpha-glucosidase